MKPLLIVIIGVIVVFLLLNLVPAMYYGIAGTPRIVLLTPCNLTVASPVNFTFKPEPSAYAHYLLQVRRDSWDSSNIIELDNLTSLSVNQALEPGNYFFNVLAHDAGHNSVAGSGPCSFIVE